MANSAGVKALKDAAASAKEELKKLNQYSEQAAIRTAVRYYLLGLPVGIVLLFIPIIAVNMLDIDTAVQSPIVVSVIAGGVGSIASVMFRLTRGQRLSVDTEQGLVVTVDSGMFRPVIGAIFGVALYTLILAGFLPLSFVGHRTSALFCWSGFSSRVQREVGARHHRSESTFSAIASFHWPSRV
jgi:hypothetical protein